jgi:hypothetical protein
MNISQTHASFSPTSKRGLKPWTAGVDYALDASLPATLQALGIGFEPGVLDDMFSAAKRNPSMFFKNGTGMDAANIQNPLTVPSLNVPLQFLQNWLPGFVAIATAVRKADEIMGMDTIGSWEDEQIVQQVLELSGSPVPYTDIGVVPLTDWNLNFVQRTVVRMELGMHVGKLEQARSARVRIDSADEKRASATLQLEIQRNMLAFYGYNSGVNQTYGFLTDPNLLAYVTVAVGAVSGSRLWANKTFLEIQADLLTAFATLRTQTQGLVEPGKTALTLTVATDCVDYLNKTSDFGISVKKWLMDAYSNVRIIDAVQFNNANGGANVFNVHADVVDDGASTDNRKTWAQIVPAKLQFLGVAVQAKGYTEDYVNASAGALCKRPYAMVRFTGI